jgi:streptogramin lyase
VKERILKTPGPKGLAAKTAPEERRPVRRIILFFLALGTAIAVIVGLTALLIYNSLSAPRHEGKAVVGGVTVTTFASLPGDIVFPMGLAIGPDGSLYASLFGAASIVKLDNQGKPTPYLQTGITAPGALAFGPDKALYMVDFSSTNPRQAVGAIKHFTAEGTAVRFGVTPAGKDLPLFAQLTFDGQGNLYVTNPSAGQVWRFDPSGSGSIWWSAPSSGNNPAQPTAIVYDATQNALIVGDAGTGSIYRLDVASKGGNALLMVRQNGLDVQGLTLDEKGQVYVAAWDHDNGQLLRLESDGGLTILASGFRAPTAIVYRDQKIYVANSDVLGLVPPFLGIVQSPLRARPPFTIDVVDVSHAAPAIRTPTPNAA